MFICLLKSDSYSLLERAHTTVADTRVSGRDVFDQVLGADQPTDTPARSVEVLPPGAHCQSSFGDLRG